MKRFQPSGYGLIPDEVLRSHGVGQATTGALTFPVFKTVLATLATALLIEIVAGEIAISLRPLWRKRRSGCP